MGWKCIEEISWLFFSTLPPSFSHSTGARLQPRLLHFFWRDVRTLRTKQSSRVEREHSYVFSNNSAQAYKFHVWCLSVHFDFIQIYFVPSVCHDIARYEFSWKKGADLHSCLQKLLAENVTVSLYLTLILRSVWRIQDSFELSHIFDFSGVSNWRTGFSDVEITNWLIAQLNRVIFIEFLSMLETFVQKEVWRSSSFNILEISSSFVQRSLTETVMGELTSDQY